MTRGVLLLAAVACAGCRTEANVPRNRPVVRFVVGDSNDQNYVAFAREYAKVLPGIDVRPHVSRSAVEALEAIQNGRADAGFNVANLTYLAYAGRMDGHERFDRLRAIGGLGILPLYLIARADSGIASVADLRGRPVALGVPDGATQWIARSVLAAFGVQLGELSSSTRLSSEAFPVERLRSGTLEAFFALGVYSAESVHMALRGGATLVPIHGPPVDQLRESNRFLQLALIPAGSFEGQLTDIQTIGVPNLLICSRDLDPQIVYEMTKGFLAGASQLTTAIDSFKFIDLTKSDATWIPLHDGAARYYREREIFP